jgi:hypothetical protein
VWITRAPPRDTRKGGKSRRTAESTFRGSGVSKRFRQRLAQSIRNSSRFGISPAHAIQFW